MRFPESSRRPTTIISSWDGSLRQPGCYLHPDSYRRLGPSGPSRTENPARRGPFVVSDVGAETPSRRILNSVRNFMVCNLLPRNAKTKPISRVGPGRNPIATAEVKETSRIEVPRPQRSHRNTRFKVPPFLELGSFELARHEFARAFPALG